MVREITGPWRYISLGLIVSLISETLGQELPLRKKVTGEFTIRKANTRKQVLGNKKIYLTTIAYCERLSKVINSKKRRQETRG